MAVSYNLRLTLFSMPVISLANYVVNSSYKQALNESSSSLQTDIDSDSIFEIFDGITLSSTVLEMIETSKQNFQDWTGKHEHCVQSFQGYGSNRIKTFGFSPDAYVQIAMQVATSRLFQKQVGTYEATMVRSFLHGRTETTRTVSPQSSAFVKAMNDFSFPNGEKINLLKAACSAHSLYIGNASEGFGIDRHFLGLSLLLRDNEHLPDLYSDPVFIRSKKWRVSTSNLTTSTISSWGKFSTISEFLFIYLFLYLIVCYSFYLKDTAKLFPMVLDSHTLSIKIMLCSA